VKVSPDPIAHHRERGAPTKPALPPVTVKVGENWIPKSGRNGGFTVLEVSKTEVTVEVERFVSKGETVVGEKRRRTIPIENLSLFALGYEKA
jgi:hypothetical protein